MQLFKRYLQSEITRSVENGIRLNVIGRRDRLNPELVEIIERAEDLTACGNRMLLRIAVDYSARDAVANSAHTASAECACLTDGTQRTCFEAALAAQMHATAPSGDVDLLIRSGGERRLSDFMLWECAYAELVFLDTYWPDFAEQEFAEALEDFDRRERRFGSVPVARPSANTPARLPDENSRQRAGFESAR